MATVNLAPARVDLAGVRAGDRNLLTFAILSGGAAVDLTGKTVQAQARPTPTDEAVLSAVIDVTDPTNGAGSLRWPGDDVTTLLDGAAKFVGVWDMQITTPGEDPQTVAAGSFAAEMDVTRP